MVVKRVKKAAPVRKKAVATKTVTKKAAPVRKKAVAKKAVAKKSAPVRKKAVAKKSAPVRKKAVAKKAAPARKKGTILKSAKQGILALPVPEIVWLDQELVLPKFLQEAPKSAKKEIVATQQYIEKKNKYPKPVFLAVPLLLLIVSFFLISPKTSGQSDQIKSDLAGSVESNATGSSISITETETTVTAPSPEQSQSTGKGSTVDTKNLAPRKFKSEVDGQEITFRWRAPIKTDQIFGYELFAKKAGSDQWIVISAQTPLQTEVSVDLISASLTTEYRIASVLDTGDLVFNTGTLKLPGLVE
ncbi:Fibronectin type III [Candidatus Nanopelagicaceae bacterium]